MSRALVILGLAAALMLLVTQSRIIQSDEGHTLVAAWNMWNGRRMYDDFRYFFAPGSAYGVYWLWRSIGSPSFLPARVLSLLLLFSSIVALYLLLARRGIRGFGLALALVGWVIASAQYPPLNHNTFSTYAAAWLLLLFVRAQERSRDGVDRPIDHLLVGVAAGAVTLFLQTKGLMLLGMTGAFTLLAARGRRGLVAAAAIAVGAIVVLAPLLLRWHLSVLIREWFIVPLTGQYLAHSSGSAALAIACLGLAAAMAAVAIWLRDRTLIAVAAVQAALIASILYNVERSHVAINTFPLFAFVPLAWHRYAQRRRPPGAAPAAEKLPAPVAMAIIVLTFAAAMATPAGRRTFEGSTLYVDFVRRLPRNIFPQPRVAAAHAIYAGPFLPGFYYLLGKPNPFSVSEATVCNDAACQRHLLAEVQSIRPEIAFLSYDMVRHFNYDPNNPVDAYLRDHYFKCPNADYEGLIVRAIDPSWCP